MIAPNRCPYCDAPYTVDDRGCADHCRTDERAKQLIREALDHEEQRVQDLIAAGLPYSEP